MIGDGEYKAYFDERDGYFDRDKKFYELGIERNKAILETLIACINMSDQKTFTKEQVIKLLRELLK